jgi:hypothetical protein
MIVNYTGEVAFIVIIGVVNVVHEVVVRGAVFIALIGRGRRRRRRRRRRRQQRRG